MALLTAAKVVHHPPEEALLNERAVISISRDFIAGGIFLSALDSVPFEPQVPCRYVLAALWTAAA
jgi:hypothetical protein